MAWVHSSVFFLWQFCDVESESGNDPHQDLARFGYKLNIKLLKHPTCTIFGYLLKPCTEIWRFRLSFDEFWLLKISKKNMI
jgi:hypothetical protein